MWLKPLHSEFNGESLHLYATNHFILDWVRDKYHGLITESLRTLYGQDAPNLIITVRRVAQQNSIASASSVPTTQQAQSMQVQGTHQPYQNNQDAKSHAKQEGGQYSQANQSHQDAGHSAYNAEQNSPRQSAHHNQQDAYPDAQENRQSANQAPPYNGGVDVDRRQSVVSSQNSENGAHYNGAKQSQSQGGQSPSQNTNPFLSKQNTQHHHESPVGGIDINLVNQNQGGAVQSNSNPELHNNAYSGEHGKAPIPLSDKHKSNVNPEYTFDNFVEGKSNQYARAAAIQVANNPGKSYNPLFLYGGTGLGKTHLTHAVGNGILANKPDAKIVYMHSERFVQDMVKALQNNAIEEFKRFYRSVDALLIDDIQFFANKDRSQEEFFHTFNALLEGNQQIILTSDRYPKEIDGVEDRLKSRFGWGLTVVIEPPELETRVAILMRKAHECNVHLPNEVAFFMAKRLRSNVRELEGALNRVIANANFSGRPITIDFVRDALRDLLALQDKLVTIENIQKTVADYYKIKVADILSKRRSRSVARPRQVAMALAKELTNHSLPEIGNAFGGRDHTTVIHAVRKVVQLRNESHDIKEDYKNLIRTLSS